MSGIVILQSDPGWLPERRGRLTASRMNDACAYRKDGKETEARRKYKIELVGERMYDHAVDHYVSPAMQRGLDYEAEARRHYESRTGNIVESAALIHHPRIELFSATPDGFIDHNGLLEIKVPLLTTFLQWLTEGEIPEEHVMQMTAQMACTGRDWVDFYAYCPEAQRGFLRRLDRDEESIANCEASAKQFLAEVEALFDLVTTTTE